MLDGLFSVRGKTVLITGGTSGIGRMAAEGLVEAGADVTIVARSRENCDATVEELSGQGAIAAIPCDLSRLAGIAELYEQFGARPLNILINCAGIHLHKPIEDFTEEMWDRSIDTNLKAAFFVAQAFLPNLRAGATEADPSRIINFSSGHGSRIPAFNSFAYTSSKAALNHLTRHLAQTLAREHVTVNAIAPGMFPSVNTAEFSPDLLDRIAEGIPRGRLGEPEDIVGAVIYLSSRAGAYTTSTVLPVDGGWAGIS